MAVTVEEIKLNVLRTEEEIEKMKKTLTEKLCIQDLQLKKLMFVNFLHIFNVLFSCLINFVGTLELNFVIKLIKTIPLLLMSIIVLVSYMLHKCS